MRMLLRYLLLLLVLAHAGCIIGTWPTPESSDRGVAEPGDDFGGSLAPDGCDGRDNDADGAIDEGCPCASDVRACMGVGPGGCGLGLQRCAGGVWQECGELGPPFTPAREPAVSIVEVEPQALEQNGSERLIVRVAVVTRCAGIQAAGVRVALESTTPVMRARGVAVDGGAAPDEAAGDAVFACELVNPFGPGVPAQELVLRAAAVIDGDTLATSAGVALEEAP